MVKLFGAQVLTELLHHRRIEPAHTVSFEESHDTLCLLHILLLHFFHFTPVFSFEIRVVNKFSHVQLHFIGLYLKST